MRSETKRIVSPKDSTMSAKICIRNLANPVTRAKAGCGHDRC